MSNACRSIYLLPLVLGALGMADDAAAQSCPTMRKINIGVSVAPPNVVHTSPYVAKELGFFAKRCIDANIIQFEGGQSATANAAAAQGSAIISVSDVAIGRGMKVQQFWGLAPRISRSRSLSNSSATRLLFVRRSDAQRFFGALARRHADELQFAVDDRSRGGPNRVPIR